MFAAFVTLALVATSALAVPHEPRAVTPECAALGSAFSSGGPYTLFARNATQSDHSDDLGAVLFTTPAAVSPNGVRQLTVATSGLPNDFPTWALSAGALFAANSTHTATDVRTAVGAPARFDVTKNGGLIELVSMYCGIPGSSPAGGNPKYPILVRPDALTSGFSLCSTKYDLGGRLNTLIFGASQSDAGIYNYDFSTCYPVLVQLVPA